MWPYVAELFRTHPVERSTAAAGVGVDPAGLRGEFDDVLAQVLRAADLEVPDGPSAGLVGGRAGREGVHSEAMGPLLAEMQSVARAHPDGLW